MKDAASKAIVVLLCSSLISSVDQSVACGQGDGLSEARVLESIDLAKRALIGQQKQNGSWTATNHVTGVTALATLALLNAGMTPDDPEIRRALTWLRDNDNSALVYEVSLLLMVYATVKDRQDRVRMKRLANDLEDAQIRRGAAEGCWTYATKDGLLQGGGDHSNGQFAVLGLYEAAHAGVSVSRETWERARAHWERTQCADGGWNYTPSSGSSGTGSMTVAGIAAAVMTAAMLQEDGELDANGNPDCCTKIEEDLTLKRGLRWLEKNFSVGSNPRGGGWLFYYLYGLERAGRLSGQRFFGDNDWYRQGARFLVSRQQQRTGFWIGTTGNESDPVIGTSFGLLFLSKGLSPVLINKLKFRTSADMPNDDTAASWNRHPFDIRNLTDRITGSEGWPKLMTWQVVDMSTVAQHGGLEDLTVSRVTYLSSESAPTFTDQEVQLLRDYVNSGGLIFAVNNCGKTAFHDAIQELVERMYPNGETSLNRLAADHPIFRAEYLLDGNTVELWGADFGCRTAIIYSPDDLACLWSRWSRVTPLKRPPALNGRIERSMRVGVNVVAYATGREPPNKLEGHELAVEDDQVVNIRRGLTQIAQVRHTGGWDTAPDAARNLMIAVNKTVGLTVSTNPAAVTPSDETLFDYSLLVMHGRERFSMSADERQRLRKYLMRGRLLLADACCGSPQFDRSFRAFAEKLFPGKRLERIPVDDELFSELVGHNLDRVRRRVTVPPGAGADGNIVAGEPRLEGIRINGRWTVIYSKYDLSCALQRQSSVACTGYVSEDAVKIAVNVVLYSSQKRARFPKSP